MNLKTWQNIVAHLFVLCGIRKMPDAEHGLYIADMFAELKDKFSDDEIMLAARQIAETENLYGNYPPLSVWLKYCPARRAAELQNKTVASDFIENIQQICDCPVWLEDSVVDMHNKYGDRGDSVIRQFGGLYAIRQRLYNADTVTRENVLREIRRAWAESATDSAVGALKISQSNQPFMIADKK